MPRQSASARVALGDWQTPSALAAEVVAHLAADGVVPATVIEPTCGQGGLLLAAQARWPQARLEGYELNAAHVAQARAALGPDAHLEVSDFFGADWEQRLQRAAPPVLLLGNPPWVTSAVLGALGSKNLPEKTNKRGHRGLDARTGKSNFDVSEWMLLRLLEAARGRDVALAMLCKTAVARRVLEEVVSQNLPVGGALFRIDAKAHFEAAVDAVLLVLRPRAAAPSSWPVFATLRAPRPTTRIGVVDGVLAADLEAFERSRALAGRCEPEWRSGLKHDCARVMELVRDGATLRNGAGEAVEIEPEHVYPLLKGSDLANGRLEPRRAVIVPQRRLGEDTATLRSSAPRTYAYLEAHRGALDARRSSIYAGQPAFSVFGVGQYTWAPWKVCVSGLYKRLAFVVVGPSEGRPVVLDDTCYFLPFSAEEQARAAAEALRSAPAQEFFLARIFWDNKRPIRKDVLQALDLDRVAALLRRDPARAVVASGPGR